MKIQDLKVVYICPDHNEKYRARKEHMDALLTRIGIRQFEHFKSSTGAYPDCLSQATIDILKANMDCPVFDARRPGIRPGRSADQAQYYFYIGG